MGKYGIITRDGVLIDPRYELVKPPVYGDLFLFMDNGKYGYLDAAGNIAVPPEFDTAEAFARPWAIVETSEKYGLLNSSGVLTVVPNFDHLSWVASNQLTASRGMESGKLDPVTGIFTPSIIETPVSAGSDTAPMTAAEIAEEMQALFEDEGLCDYAVRENYSSKDLILSCGVADLEVKASSNNCSNCYIALAEHYAEAKGRDFNPDKSIKNSGMAISLDPSNPQPYKLRAKMLLEYEDESYFEDFPQAINDYLKLAELQPENLATKTDACIAGGKSPGLLGKDAETAIAALCDEALKVNRSDVRLWLARAGIFAAIGENTKAIDDLDAALALDKSSSDAFRAKAEIYAALKDWRRAAFYFSKAIENTKGHAGDDLYEGRGRAYLHMKACTKAKSDFDAAGKGLRSAANLHHMAAYYWTCDRDLPNTLQHVEKLLMLGDKCEGPCYRPEQYKEFLSGLTDTAEYKELAGKYSWPP
jgi:tetratricopeptide (TPR) repeat protein